MSPWISWIAASVSAGVGGVFVLLTYIHSNFVSAHQLEVHVSQPHKEAVSIDRYNEDIRYLREQITEINRKLDRAIQNRQ
jgi:hypothetical protein